MSVRVQCVVLDSPDPRRVAPFWRDALGWRITYDTPGEVCLEPPEGSALSDVVPDLVFVQVPEPKSGKNRLHIELRPEDQAAELERLEALGATRVDIGQGAEVTWVVLADPDGNEFCLLRALTPEELAQA